MKKVIFALAGIRQEYEKVWLTSKHRKKSYNYTIFHNNDNHTEYAIPCDILKKYFTFDRSMHIYRTTLTHGQLRTLPNVEYVTWHV